LDRTTNGSFRNRKNCCANDGPSRGFTFAFRASRMRTPSRPEGIFYCGAMPALVSATIAELSRKSGGDVVSTRRYDKLGLLPSPRRRCEC
jgi:hypothetical protein